MFKSKGRFDHLLKYMDKEDIPSSNHAVSEKSPELELNSINDQKIEVTQRSKSYEFITKKIEDFLSTNTYYYPGQEPELYIICSLFRACESDELFNVKTIIEDIGKERLKDKYLDLFLVFIDYFNKNGKISVADRKFFSTLGLLTFGPTLMKFETNLEAFNFYSKWINYNMSDPTYFKLGIVTNFSKNILSELYQCELNIALPNKIEKQLAYISKDKMKELNLKIGDLVEVILIKENKNLIVFKKLPIFNTENNLWNDYIEAKSRFSLIN